MLCKYCNNEAVYQFKNGSFCCSRHPSGCPELQRRKKETCKNKYGNENFRNVAKSKTTRAERYNDYGNNRRKAKNTCTARYGVDNPSKCQTVKDKKIATFDNNYPRDSDEYNALMSQKKYSWSTKDHELINEKRETTNLAKYGVTNPGKLEETIAKRKDTNFRRYGVEHASQSIEIRKKIERTCFERFGVSNPSQHPSIHEKQQKYKWKEYIFPSGRSVKVQGYENKALDILTESYNECDIIVERKNQPSIWYEYDTKTRRYYPDIFLVSNNTIIEVKSEWTFSVRTEQHIAKMVACIEAGYYFEFWIFDTQNNLRTITYKIC